MVTVVREGILTLFPDGEGAYELIYAPRFRRFVDEFAEPDPEPRSIVLPFTTGRG